MNTTLSALEAGIRLKLTYSFVSGGLGINVISCLQKNIFKKITHKVFALKTARNPYEEVIQNPLD